MRRVKHIMGMPITIDIPGCTDEDMFTKVFKLFIDIDERFSPYKNNSELCRYNRGEIKKTALSYDMKTVIQACKQYEKATSGYFSAWYKNEFDPSGYVKGWAIKKAGDVIRDHGHNTYCIGAGGDILASSVGEKTWSIGIQDPKNKAKILKILAIKNGAVATSGTYERGKHIYNPESGKPADDFLSLTVVGPDIITADVLATAAFAKGITGIDIVKSVPGYRAYAYPGK